jgi:hypothetical protein
MRRTLGTFVALSLAVAALATVPAPPASAVNPPQSTIVSANPVNWTPHVLDGIVNAIVPVGNQIVAGGTFTQVKEPGGPILSRTNIFAFDAATGAINTDFAPVLDGEVLSLATDGSGSSVFVGGSFSTVNGQKYRRLVKLDLATGQRMTFAGKINTGAAVYDMTVSNGKLYVGGAFSTVNKQSRQRIAAFDLPAGTLDPNLSVTFAGKHNDGTVRVHKLDVSPDGTKLVAIGNFLTANGLDRRQIAMLNLTTTPVSVSNWQTSRFVPQCTSRFDTYMRDVDFDPTGQYFVIGTTGAWMGGPNAGVLCDTVSRWRTADTGANVQPEWVDYTGGDTTFSVAATGTAVYVGGHQRWWNNPWVADRQGPGAVSRPGIAALDPLNGLPFRWNPVRDPRGLGVQALVATDQGLWVGSDTANIGGEYHGEIAMMPIEGGTAVPKHVNFDLPNELYSLPTGPGSVEYLSHRPFNGTTPGTTVQQATAGTNWGTARGAFFTNGKIYAGWSDGTFTSQTFDGTTLGPKQPVTLNGLTNSYWPASNLSGMALENGRLFYTVSGDPRMYFRYFTPESDVVGAQTFTVSGNGDGFSWSDVSGLTLSGAKLYFARSNGNLYSVNWVNGRPSGSIATLGGPAIDGRNWTSRGMFVWGQNADKTAPTVPGTPAGVSTTTTSIDLTWSASTDSVSQVIEYRVYRDGAPAPVATIASASTASVSYVDVGLDPSSTHTYRVSAMDEAGNESTKSGTSASIQVMAPDLNPPTVPGTPAGVAASKTQIDVTWAASIDDGGAPITYRVYRDGGPSPVGSITSASTASVTFEDAGLDVASSHTYQVDAVDESGNPSAKSPVSEPISTGGTFWADGFDTADFSAWTSVRRMSIDSGAGGAAPPSALASPVAKSAVASKTLGTNLSSICLSANIDVTDQGTEALDLFRLRTAGNGNVGRVLLNAKGILQVKSDVSRTVKGSGSSLSAGWHSVEACVTVGTAGTWDLYLDGLQVVSGWVADNGTAPVGRIQIGSSSARTFTVNFDDVVVDGYPG